MKNRQIIIIASMLIILGAMFLSYSIYSHKNRVIEENQETQYISEFIEDDCTDEYISMHDAKTVSSVQEKVSANALLVLKKYFKTCEHTTNEYVELPQELVNMTKEEVQSKYPKWEVIGFESGKVTLYKEFDDECGEHFKLKVEDGKVVVYKINKDETESLYEKTNISSEYLTETDLINMQDGLEIYGIEELNKIIEDFE